MVKNGSVGLKVSGSRSPGSGSLAISSSSWFCQKQKPTASDEDDRRDDDPRAQLVEVLDQRHALVELG